MFRLIRKNQVYSEWFWAYVFLAVDLAWSTLFLFYPMIKGIIFSFQDITLENISNVHFVGFRNYIQVLTDVDGWWHSVKVSALYTLGVVPMGVMIPFFIALLLNNFKKGVKDFFKAAFYLPAVVSIVIYSMTLKWIFDPMHGFMNWLLENLGLPPQPWYSSESQALFTLILMRWISSHGFGILLYSAALDRIPKTLYEAAEIDAASSWKKFWKITWPLLKPTTLYVTIISLIGAFQAFGGAFFITKGGPMRATEFINYRIYREFYELGEYNMAATMSVLLMFIIVAISAVSFKVMGSEVEY